MTAFAPMLKKATAKSAGSVRMQEPTGGQQKRVDARQASSLRYAPPGLLHLPVYAPDPGLRKIDPGHRETKTAGARAASFAKHDAANNPEKPAAVPAGPNPASPVTTPASPQPSPEPPGEATQTGGAGQSGGVSGSVPDVRTPPGQGRSTEPELAVADTPEADIPADISGEQRVPVTANFHLRGYQPRMDRPAGIKTDPAVSGVAMGTFSQPGGRAVSPFGSEFYEPAFTGISFAFAGGKCTISGNLDTICPWGTNAGGDIDVPSATAPVVTAATWQAIHDDLKPGAASPFKSPRDKYYSQTLVERHEKFHGTDDLGWTTSTGIGFVKSTVEAGSIPEPHGLSILSTIFAVADLLDKARTKLIAENLTFYKGGGADHDSFAGEIRAYADGRPEYQKLADAVEVQGKKLAAPPPAPAVPAPAPGVNRPSPPPPSAHP